jgi:hypothetical protein
MALGTYTAAAATGAVSRVESTNGNGYCPIQHVAGTNTHRIHNARGTLDVLLLRCLAHDSPGQSLLQRLPSSGLGGGTACRASPLCYYSPCGYLNSVRDPHRLDGIEREYLAEAFPESVSRQCRRGVWIPPPCIQAPTFGRHARAAASSSLGSALPG